MRSTEIKASLFEMLEKLGQLSSVSARAENFGVIDDPLLENLGVIGKFRGSELFLCIITLCLRMRLYLSYFKNVPYRKIKVFLKFGACFTIFDGFCYIFCFMGIIQCYVACK